MMESWVLQNDGITEWKHAISVVKNQWHHLHTFYWLNPKLDLFWRVERERNTAVDMLLWAVGGRGGGRGY